MSRQGNRNGKTISTQAAMDKAIKGICDILRRDKAKGARLYVPELTWIFFLRFFDVLEQQEEVRRRPSGGLLWSPFPPHTAGGTGQPRDESATVQVAPDAKAQAGNSKN